MMHLYPTYLYFINCHDLKENVVMQNSAFTSDIWGMIVHALGFVKC